MSVMGWTIGAKIFLTLVALCVSAIAGFIAGVVSSDAGSDAKAATLWFFAAFLLVTGLSGWGIWGAIPGAYYGQAQYIGMRDSVEKDRNNNDYTVKRAFVHVDGRKLKLSGDGIEQYNEGDTVWVRCSGGMGNPGCKLH